ncbi:MAG: DUF3800 domain-containing protein [Candidatus Omnitrophota bacterium]
MYLIYMDESGQTGNNLNDPAQPIFILAALIVPETVWLALEKDLVAVIDKYFPAPRPMNFEIHAKSIYHGESYFRQYPMSHRLSFRDEWLSISQRHNLKLIYRSIVKKRYRNWIRSTFGSGVSINPHVAAFPLVAHVVNDYLASLQDSPLGIFIVDENREIISDVEKAIYLLRGAEGNLKLDRIIEKGFFIDSSKSFLLQLCDLCAYSAKKKEERKEGLPIKPIDEGGIQMIEPLIQRGDEALQDTLEWLIEQQKEKAARE